jgi:hypothetical protein
MKMYHYDMTPGEKFMAQLGRELVSSAENMTIQYDDESWNAAITAGDKLTRFGTTYGPKSLTKDFTKEERRVILQFMDKRNGKSVK